MDVKELVNLAVRYALIVLIGLFGIDLIYQIFTPIVIYPAFWLLSIFYPGILLNNTAFLFNSYVINVVPACIAGAAYYLLIILNLATPMGAKTRLRSLAFVIIAFTLLNILRLSIFSSLFISGYDYFDLAHKAAWYLGSTLLVVILWFVSVYLFRIKAIPAATDFKNLLSNKDSRRKKRK